MYIEDYEGCIVEYTLNVDEPLEALSIDSMNVISPIACYGDSVGIARLYVSGGDPVVICGIMERLVLLLVP